MKVKIVQLTDFFDGGNDQSFQVWLGKKCVAVLDYYSELYHWLQDAGAEVEKYLVLDRYWENEELVKAINRATGEEV